MYHLAGLKDVLELEALRPGLLTPAALQAATKALNLTKPYVNGTKTHDELVCTTVAFDRERARAGQPGFSGPFDPVSQKIAFRYGRIAVPSSRTWTGALANDAYTSWMKVFVAGQGDSITYP